MCDRILRQNSFLQRSNYWDFSRTSHFSFDKNKNSVVHRTKTRKMRRKVADDESWRQSFNHIPRLYIIKQSQFPSNMINDWFIYNFRVVETCEKFASCDSPTNKIELSYQMVDRWSRISCPWTRCGLVLVEYLSVSCWLLSLKITLDEMGTKYNQFIKIWREIFPISNCFFSVIVVWPKISNNFCR